MFSPTITYMDTYEEVHLGQVGRSYVLGGSGRELGPEVQSGLRPHRSAEDLRLPAGLFPAEEGADNPANQHPRALHVEELELPALDANIELAGNDP